LFSILAQNFHDLSILVVLVLKLSLFHQEKEIRRFAGTVPNVTTRGDIESMVMYAGEGVGLIKEILPAGEVVQKLVEGAQHLIHQKFSGIQPKVEPALVAN
jgi:hypothetical protein